MVKKISFFCRPSFGRDIVIILLLKACVLSGLCFFLKGEKLVKFSNKQKAFELHFFSSLAR